MTATFAVGGVGTLGPRLLPEVRARDHGRQHIIGGRFVLTAAAVTLTLATGGLVALETRALPEVGTGGSP